MKKIVPIKEGNLKKIKLKFYLFSIIIIISLSFIIPAILGNGISDISEEYHEYARVAIDSSYLSIEGIEKIFVRQIKVISIEIDNESKQPISSKLVAYTYFGIRYAEIEAYGSLDTEGGMNYLSTSIRRLIKIHY